MLSTTSPEGAANQNHKKETDDGTVGARGQEGQEWGSAFTGHRGPDP